MQDLNKNESLDMANIQVRSIELWAKQSKSKRNKSGSGQLGYESNKLRVREIREK